ncbi:MAG: hypothetical protein JSR62_15540 [Nitrospira sp.]|nr:hypothetical protein [Nitrospira sp.]
MATAVGTACGILLSSQIAADATAAAPDSSPLWRALIVEAHSLHLPTRFLEQIPEQFVAFEFEDLHAFAAEYHPADHRMVLDRSLSLNGAGRMLRPLGKMTHKELDTLYHELFHAYMDYLEHESAPSDAHVSFMSFAREQQRCRYQQVLITPVLQKRSVKEERFLSEGESWEALNETWAMFIGWAVWTQLEVDAKAAAQKRPPGKTVNVAAWIARLDQAEGDAALTGYYEPEDPAEKAMARKRFLAPEFRLSAPEMSALMREVLGSPSEMIRQAGQVLGRSRSLPAKASHCTGSPAQ